MRTPTSTSGQAASAPDLEPYLRIHRLLRLSAAELAATIADRPPSGARSNRALRRWYRGFAGEIRCHHHIEDVLLFPALERRVAVFAEHAPRLVGDHAELDVVLDGLSASIAAGSMAEAATLAGSLRDHLDQHLGYEDDEIAPLFARHFTAIEFAELNDQAVAMTSPKQLVFTAPWLLSFLDDAERAELLQSVPRAMTVLWWLTRGRYRRITRRAFGEHTSARL